MFCRKCNKEIADTPFCPFCGTKQEQPRGGVKRRGNGQGSVYKENGKWTASKVFGYYLDKEGKQKPMRTSKRGFTTKKEALLALASLERRNGRKIDETASFQKWHISNFFRMGNTSLLFLFVISGFYEIGFWRI